MSDDLDLDEMDRLCKEKSKCYYGAEDGEPQAPCSCGEVLSLIERCRKAERYPAAMAKVREAYPYNDTAREIFDEITREATGKE